MTKEESARRFAQSKGIKPSDWKSWAVVKKADANTGEIRRDKAGRHWEGTYGDLRKKMYARPVPHPSGGAPATQPFSGEDIDED